VAGAVARRVAPATKGPQLKRDPLGRRAGFGMTLDGRELFTPMDLPAFLLAAGFRQIPLSRTGVGHFQMAGQLNGRPVAVLIDTGAASTVFNLALGQQLGLTLQKADHQGGGAGAARLDIYFAPNADLRLGDFRPRIAALMGVDLTHANQALALNGQRPVDVILGADVFDAHKAVIDYGTHSLFLRP